MSAAATAEREFLFNYRFGGCEWGITIHANDPAEAIEKIKAVGLARYEGEVFLSGHVGSLPFARLFVWIKNLRRAWRQQ